MFKIKFLSLAAMYCMALMASAQMAPVCAPCSNLYCSGLDGEVNYADMNVCHENVMFDE